MGLLLVVLDFGQDVLDQLLEVDELELHLFGQEFGEDRLSDLLFADDQQLEGLVLGVVEQILIKCILSIVGQELVLGEVGREVDFLFAHGFGGEVVVDFGVLEGQDSEVFFVDGGLG